MICVVTAEPTAAPMLTTIACATVRTPAETNPMAMTEVTVEDCTTAVIAAPVSSALRRLPARLAMMVLICEPAMVRIAFDIRVMPCRNNAKPPASPISMGMRNNESSMEHPPRH